MRFRQTRQEIKKLILAEAIIKSVQQTKEKLKQIKKQRLTKDVNELIKQLKNQLNKNKKITEKYKKLPQNLKKVYELEYAKFLKYNSLTIIELNRRIKINLLIQWKWKIHK